MYFSLEGTVTNSAILLVLSAVKVTSRNRAGEIVALLLIFVSEQAIMVNLFTFFQVYLYSLLNAKQLSILKL